MANNLKRLDSYLVPGKHIHLIGIGGVSMRPLGLVLRGMGITVTGSDMNASVSTDELVAKGIEVHIGHRGLHHPHGRRPQRQSRGRRGPCAGHPRVRAGAGLGRDHARI